MTYHSLDQLLAAEKTIEAAIGASAGLGAVNARRKYASYRSGC